MRTTYTLLLTMLCAAFALPAFAESNFEVIKMPDIKWAP